MDNTTLKKTDDSDFLDWLDESSSPTPIAPSASTTINLNSKTPSDDDLSWLDDVRSPIPVKPATTAVNSDFKAAPSSNFTMDVSTDSIAISSSTESGPGTDFSSWLDENVSPSHVKPPVDIPATNFDFESEPVAMSGLDDSFSPEFMDATAAVISDCDMAPKIADFSLDSLVKTIDIEENTATPQSKVKALMDDFFNESSSPKKLPATDVDASAALDSLSEPEVTPALDLDELVPVNNEIASEPILNKSGSDPVIVESASDAIFISEPAVTSLKTDSLLDYNEIVSDDVSVSDPVSVEIVSDPASVVSISEPIHLEIVSDSVPLLEPAMMNLDPQISEIISDPISIKDVLDPFTTHTVLDSDPFLEPATTILGIDSLLDSANLEVVSDYVNIEKTSDHTTVVDVSDPFAIDSFLDSDKIEAALDSVPSLEPVMTTLDIESTSDFVNFEVAVDPVSVEIMSDHTTVNSISDPINIESDVKINLDPVTDDFVSDAVTFDSVSVPINIEIALDSADVKTNPDIVTDEIISDTVFFDNVSDPINIETTLDSADVKIDPTPVNVEVISDNVSFGSVSDPVSSESISNHHNIETVIDPTLSDPVATSLNVESVSYPVDLKNILGAINVDPSQDILSWLSDSPTLAKSATATTSATPSVSSDFDIEHSSNSSTDVTRNNEADGAIVEASVVTPQSKVKALMDDFFDDLFGSAKKAAPTVKYSPLATQRLPSVDFEKKVERMVLSNFVDVPLLRTLLLDGGYVPPTLRGQVWCLLLTGSPCSKESELDGTERFSASASQLASYYLLTTDCEAASSSASQLRKNLQDILTLYCTRKDIEYSSVLCKILTPLLLEPNPLSQEMASSCFSSIASDFIPLLSLKPLDKEAGLDKMYSWLRLLVSYHSPAVGQHLDTMLPGWELAIKGNANSSEADSDSIHGKKSWASGDGEKGGKGKVKEGCIPLHWISGFFSGSLPAEQSCFLLDWAIVNQLRYAGI
jgi:hypothetical protein